MDSKFTERSPRRRFLLFQTASCLLLLGLMIGCPDAGLLTNGTSGDMGDDGTPTSDDTQDVTGRIVNILGNIPLSVRDPAISVSYSVTGTPDSITGFFVAVPDNSPGAVSIGDRTTVASGLPATGANTTFLFFPEAAGVGFYRVGILMTVGEMELEVLSTGIIHVQGLPEPCFVLPCEVITEPVAGVEPFRACGDTLCEPINEVTQGDTVPISFDAGDPENDARWRVFFLTPTDSRTDPPDPLGGTQIAVGEDNSGFASLSTTDLAPAIYELGVSATDSGLSVAATVAADGDDRRIVTVFGPLVRVTVE